MLFSVRSRAGGYVLGAGCLGLVALTAPASSATPTTLTSATTLTSVTTRISMSQQARVVPLAKRLSTRHWQAPPTTGDCLAIAGIPCYAPVQLQQAYNLKPLYDEGLNGTGSTIVIVDSFGSPTALADLQAFDQDFGLPDPPHFDVLQPAGAVPAFDPTDPTMAGWAEETSLDLQWAHSVAPGADILLVETPVAETEGVQGLPEMVQAENYVIDHGLGDVISQSFGASEPTIPSKKTLRELRSAFISAATHKVTVLAASGDAGPTDYQLNGEDFYPQPANSWPSTDPLVTSIGGTQLHLDAAGNRTAPDNVWNDTALFGSPAAGGGGVSSFFDRPSFQDPVASVVGDHRGTPDISLSAAVNGGVLVRIGFTGGDGITPGYYIFGGTSEATPEFAGIVAIARQVAHHRLGLINRDLYRLADQGAPGIVDVTRGDNTVTFDQDETSRTVTGFPATAGYDLASGLGTVNAYYLAKELAR
jgi:subtilase family serine protease